MKHRKCIYDTAEQNDYLDRDKQGDSLHDIVRMFDRYHSSIMPTIYQTSGYRPLNGALAHSFPVQILRMSFFTTSASHIIIISICTHIK